MYKRNCEIKPGVEFPSGMRRVACLVEYDGSQYQGFQFQKSADITVQGALQRAFSKVADEEITLICAGRTDAGVHAIGQVVHFDTLSERPSRAWIKGTNTHLPESIRVHWASEISESFHARFSALHRSYRYVIYVGEVSPAIIAKKVTCVDFPIDVARMRAVASLLIGEHDFSSFRASQCQASSPVRNVQDLTIHQFGAFIVVDITANAFLYHMVRNIVGVLFEVGRGARPVEWVRELLALKNRACAPATAAADGLYFSAVGYPDQFKIPARDFSPLFPGF